MLNLWVSACVRVFVIFLTVRSSAQIRNFSNTSSRLHFRHHQPTLSAARSSCHYCCYCCCCYCCCWYCSSLSAMVVCVCARAIREHLLFSSSLSFSFIASLVLTKTKCSLNYATTTTKKFTPASKCACVSVCLLVGTGADRKITTADRGVFTLFKLGPPTPTLFDCAPCACVCVFWQDLR